MLITAGSGQGLDLVNRVLLEPGDTVILEEFTYGGALTKLQRRGVKIVGAPLDDDGLRIDALGRILDDLEAKGDRAEIHLHDPDDPEPDRLDPAGRAPPKPCSASPKSTAWRFSRTNATPT